MRKADNLPTSCSVVTESGSLNLLETSEPVQACNGTDLPYTICFGLFYLENYMDIIKFCYLVCVLHLTMQVHITYIHEKLHLSENMSRYTAVGVATTL